MPETAPPPDTDRPDAPPGSDADRLAHEAPTTCLNCGAVLPGAFCPDCGQRDQPIRQPAHVFITESVSEYFGLDGRLWRSLGRLLFQPGALTEAYLDGRRTRYLRPLRLYLTATLLFFFLLSQTDPLAGGTMTYILEPLSADTSLTADRLADRLDERAEVLQAERDAVLSAAALVPGLARGDSLRALADRLAGADSLLEAWDDSIRALPDDSLVAVASLPEPVRGALADTGRVEVNVIGGTLVGDLEDQLPDWAMGDLARRIAETESPTERRLLSGQYQRAVVQQVPTALFFVLPLFALLLKAFYLPGAGISPRHRPRPTLPPDAGWGRRLVHALAAARWTYGRWRTRRRVHKRRRALQRAQKRRVRGALRRARGAVWQHRALRPWRVRRLRMLRQALRRSGTPYYSEHLVFGLHVHAFTFLVGAALLAFAEAESRAAGQARLALGLSIPVYFLVAQKRVYRETWFRTLWKAVGITIAYAGIVVVGALLAAALALRLT